MREVRTSLEIAAPPDAVWRQLLDKARWARFSDLGDRDPHRPIAPDLTFTFGLRLLGLWALPITVRVIRFVPDRELCWVGRFPGFRGEHYFLLEPVAPGRTRLVHGERFSGPLGELYDGLFHQVSQEAYATFNVGLALQLERTAR
jgi:hypothetical protein